MTSASQGKKGPSISLALLTIAIGCLAQDEPSDFLTSEFHTERRTLVRDKMPDNSVAVFFASPVRNRANDVDFIYHQDPNFYYLTGYREPHAVLMIFKEEQEGPDAKYNEIIFIQPRNAMAEMWTGRRLGITGVKEKLEFRTAEKSRETFKTGRSADRGLAERSKATRAAGRHNRRLRH